MLSCLFMGKEWTVDLKIAFFWMNCWIKLKMMWEKHILWIFKTSTTGCRSFIRFIFTELYRNEIFNGENMVCLEEESWKSWVSSFFFSSSFWCVVMCVHSLHERPCRYFWVWSGNDSTLLCALLNVGNLCRLLQLPSCQTELVVSSVHVSHEKDKKMRVRSLFFVGEFLCNTFLRERILILQIPSPLMCHKTQTLNWMMPISPALSLSLSPLSLHQKINTPFTDTSRTSEDYWLVE